VPTILSPNCTPRLVKAVASGATRFTAAHVVQMQRGNGERIAVACDTACLLLYR
jgi:hypothetical protein